MNIFGRDFLLLGVGPNNSYIPQKEAETAFAFFFFGWVSGKAITIAYGLGSDERGHEWAFQHRQNATGMPQGFFCFLFW